MSKCTCDQLWVTGSFMACSLHPTVSRAKATIDVANEYYNSERTVSIAPKNTPPREWTVVDLGYDGLWLSPADKFASFDKNRCPLRVIESSPTTRRADAMREMLARVYDTQYDMQIHNDIEALLAAIAAESGGGNG